MQSVTNEVLVKRESRTGLIVLGLTFGLLAVAFLLSTQADRWAAEQEAWIPVAVTYALVLVGMGLYYLGNTRIRRYGPQYRQDARLGQILRGLDDRYALYSFLSKKLPDYILVGPGGVFILVARPQEGEFTCRGDRWTRKSSAGRRLFTALYGNPLGRPSYDAQLGVLRVREFLNQKLTEGEDVPVRALVVFTGENVRLRIEQCSFTAATAREVRRVIGKARTRLSPGRLTEVSNAFQSELQS